MDVGLVRYEISIRRCVKKAGAYMSLETRRQVEAGILSIGKGFKAVRVVEISLGWIHTGK